jgi:hypothetical protein
MRIALGFAQAGAGVSVGVSVGVSLGVSVTVGVLVGVLVELAVGVEVSVGVIVKVTVAGICVLVDGTVSVGVSIIVAVGSKGVSELQAEINIATKNNMVTSQKSLLLRIVDFSLKNAKRADGIISKIIKRCIRFLIMLKQLQVLSVSQCIPYLWLNGGRYALSCDRSSMK